MTSNLTTLKQNTTWWDRVLIAIAPGWGLRRVQARALLRHFDAAGTGRRTTGWHRSSTDVNSANSASLPKLRELSRDLRRNNGWAKRAIQVISANTVGRGIVAKAESDNPRVATEAAALWKEWSKRCDYDGRMPFTGLQRLAMDTIVESGEVLIIRERASAADGLPIPLRIRVLEPDYLDVTRQRGTVGTVQQGIEIDGNGRRLAYWMYKQHPGAVGAVTGFSGIASESIRIPAEDVLHVYHVDRPGQLRGVPWLAAAIAKLNDFDDYDDAKLMQAKIAACFGAFVIDSDGQNVALGEEDEDDELLSTLEPGHIEHLPPGKDIRFATPTSVSDHGGFSETQLRRIAASVGITYEDLTGDYSKVNFSSARMARLAHWSNVYDWRWTMIIPQMLAGVWRWFVEMAAAVENWPSLPDAKWTAPPMPMLSPEKEGLAYTRLIRSGVMSLSEAITERGNDPVMHLAEIAADNENLDALGIILDSDARKTSGSGGEQPSASDDGDDSAA